MIARQWTGICYKSRAVSYIQHLQEETFPALKSIEGFVSASIMHRPFDNHIEFVITTTWSSLEAIKEFAGEDYTTAVVPDAVRKMMISWDAAVKYYTLIDAIDIIT